MLLDTNIFLEILLDQKSKEKCKQFLIANSGGLFISDYSLHSIGLKLFKLNKHNVFTQFVKDVLPVVQLVSLSNAGHEQMENVSLKYKLDFDDAYQCCVGNERNLEIATMDQDFKNVSGFVKIHFL